MSKVILASTSPRRRELLKEIFPSFSIVSPTGEENETDTPQETVLKISQAKADSIQIDYDILISADTIVVLDNKILGKPNSKEVAFQMLRALSGKIHYVYTGVCIKYKIDEKILTKIFYDKSEVVLKNMSDEEIIRYIESGSPMDKAGAYGIQDGVVDSYKGSYSNIVGLPIEKIKDELSNLGLY